VSCALRFHREVYEEDELLISKWVSHVNICLFTLIALQIETRSQDDQVSYLSWYRLARKCNWKSTNDCCIRKEIKLYWYVSSCCHRVHLNDLQFVVFQKPVNWCYCCHGETAIVSSQIYISMVSLIWLLFN